MFMYWLIYIFNERVKHNSRRVVASHSFIHKLELTDLNDSFETMLTISERIFLSL